MKLERRAVWLALLQSLLSIFDEIMVSMIFCSFPIHCAQLNEAPFGLVMSKAYICAVDA